MFVIAGGIVLAYFVIRVGLPLVKWLVVLLAVCWAIGKLSGGH